MNRKLKGILMMSPMSAIIIYIFAQHPEMLPVFIIVISAAIGFIVGLFGLRMLLYTKEEEIKFNEVK